MKRKEQQSIQSGNAALRLLLSCAALFGLVGAAAAQTYLSPSDVTLSGDKKSLYIAAHTGRKLLRFSIDARE